VAEEGEGSEEDSREEGSQGKTRGSAQEDDGGHAEDAGGDVPGRNKRLVSVLRLGRCRKKEGWKMSLDNGRPEVFPGPGSSGGGVVIVVGVILVITGGLLVRGCLGQKDIVLRVVDCSVDQGAEVVEAYYHDDFHPECPHVRIDGQE
jgi:hypothetical protein